MIKPVPQYNGMTITFNTTEDCNLACKYCYEINKKPKSLQLDNAKKFIDLLLSEEDPINAKGTKDEWIINTGLVLDFIGGDALMDVKLVEDIVEYFQKRAWELNHKWKNRWRLSISTNGTLFDKPGVKDFMYKYAKNLSLGISIDGCPEIHNKNRIFIDGSGTMDAIIKNWEWYKTWNYENSGNPISTKATLNLESIHYLYDSIKYLYEEMGIPYINMNFVMENLNPKEEDLLILDEQLSKVKDYMLEHRNEIYLSMFDPIMSTGKPMIDSENGCDGRCGSGCMPALGINGKIYPCFRYLPHTAIDGRDDFNVGDVVNGFNRKEKFREVKAATRDKISPEKCLTCPIETMCAYCIGGCYAEFGEFKRTTYICELAKLQDKWTKLYWREYDKLEGTYTKGAYYPTWEEWNDGNKKM